MIVMKFGGTSVGGATEISSVCEIVRGRLERKPIVVVSAVKGITDKLLACISSGSGHEEVKQIHDKIIDELGLNPELLSEEFKELSEVLASKSDYTEDEFSDRIASFGERMSSKIVAAALSSKGIKAEAFNAYDIGFVTDNNFINAEILNETYKNIKKNFKFDGIVPVVTGFIAKNKSGKITTLGRGGSDYTATIIGSAIDAEEVEIWTDVNGVKTTDPKIVPEAETIDVLSFAEASELAFFGAKVLHPKTIIPAIDKKIPVRVLNTHEPRHKGTLIVHERESVRKGAIKAVTSKRNICVITITSTRMVDAYGFLEKLFRIFSKQGVSVDVVSTSEVSVSATVEGKTNLEPLVKDIEKYAHVNIEKDKALIAVVGEGLKNNSSDVAARVFRCIADEGINVHMISQGASEINLSFVINDEYVDNAIRTIHNKCIVSK